MNTSSDIHIFGFPNLETVPAQLVLRLEVGEAQLVWFGYSVIATDRRSMDLGPQPTSPTTK